jgi:hypothetical protein
LVGVISTRQITNFLTTFKLNLESDIHKAIIKDFKLLDASTSLKYLSKAFTRHTYVIVVNGDKYFIATPQDLLDHFTKNNK